jgi:hypothetical protein
VLDFVLCRADETDAHGSRILPDGVDLSRHKTNPIFLWQHQSGTNALGVAPRPEVVIGRVTDYFQTTEKLVIRVLFDMKDEMAATCYRKCVEGFLSGVSIGCRPDPEYTRVEEIDGVEVVAYGRVLLLEASLVILPSLASALVSRSQAVQLLRALGAPPVAGDAGAAPEPEDPVPPVAQETPAPVTVAQDPVPPPVETAADPLPAPAAIARAAFEPPAGVVAILTRVDEDAAAVLALPGGNAPGDLHVTLAVFDPADLAEGWLDRLAVVVSGHARSHVPLEGRVGGHG